MLIHFTLHAFSNIFLCSYFIYEISHPNKNGLPQISLVDDPEAQIDLSIALCPSKAAMERIIAKVFHRYHCDVIITDRLRSLFYFKAVEDG